MPYVMMPVPEEHEQELMNEILKISLRKSLSDWSEPSVRSVLDSSAPRSRELIALLTQAAAHNRKLSRTEVAASLGADSIELRGLVDEINERCTDRSAPYLVLTVADDSSDDPGADCLLITQVAVELLLPMLSERSPE